MPKKLKCLITNGVGSVTRLEDGDGLVVQVETMFWQATDVLSLTEHPEMHDLFTSDGQLRPDEALALFRGLDFALWEEWQ